MRLKQAEALHHKIAQPCLPERRRANGDRPPAGRTAGPRFITAGRFLAQLLMEIAENGRGKPAALALLTGQRPRNVSWLQAAGLLFGDWGTSRLYVLGIALFFAATSSPSRRASSCCF